MTVSEFCAYAIDDCQDMEIYSYKQGITVFKGTYAEAMESEFADDEVANFDIENGKFILNLADEV